MESKGILSKKTVEKVAITCSNCGNETMIDVDIFDTNYQEIITTFVLNTMLHHVGMFYTVYHLSTNLSFVFPYHILIIHYFQPSITYQHGVMLYSI